MFLCYFNRNGYVEQTFSNAGMQMEDLTSVKMEDLTSGEASEIRY